MPGHPFDGTEGTTCRQARRLAVSLMCVFMTASMTLSSLAIVAAEMQQRFGLSDGQIGMLTSVFMGFYGVAGVLSGLVAPRWGGRLLIITCGCFVIGSVVMGLSSSFAGFLAGRAIQGMGGGTVVSCCNPVMTQSVPAQRARRCWAIFGCGWGLGQTASMLVMPGIARAGGFRAVFLALAAFALTTGVVALAQKAVRSLPAGPGSTTSVSAMAASLVAVVKTPRLLLLGLTCAAHLAIGVGILVWTPSFLEMHRGATLSGAAYLTAGLGVAQVLGSLSGGAAAGRWGKHAVILASLTVMTAAAALIAVVPGRVVALVMFLLAGFASFALFPPMIAYIAQVVAKAEYVGPATGVHTVMGFVGSLVAPWIFGLALDAGTRSSHSYLEGYLMLAAFGAAAIAGMTFFRPKALRAGPHAV